MPIENQRAHPVFWKCPFRGLVNGTNPDPSPGLRTSWNQLGTNLSPDCRTLRPMRRGHPRCSRLSASALPSHIVHLLHEALPHRDLRRIPKVLHDADVLQGAPGFRVSRRAYSEPALISAFHMASGVYSQPAPSRISLNAARIRCSGRRLPAADTPASSEPRAPAARFPRRFRRRAQERASSLSLAHLRFSTRPRGGDSRTRENRDHRERREAALVSLPAVAHRPSEDPPG